MLESGTYGSVRGAFSNGRPYCNPQSEAEVRESGPFASRFDSLPLEVDSPVLH